MDSVRTTHQEIRPFLGSGIPNLNLASWGTENIPIYYKAILGVFCFPLHKPFDFGRNTPLPDMEMDIEEAPLEVDEEKSQQKRLKQKMKKELGKTFLEKMKKVAADRMATKKEGRLQSLVKQTYPYPSPKKNMSTRSSHRFLYVIYPKIFANPLKPKGAYDPKMS